jgi:hypothetical protein
VLDARPWVPCGSAAGAQKRRSQAGILNFRQHEWNTKVARAKQVFCANLRIASN